MTAAKGAVSDSQDCSLCLLFDMSIRMTSVWRFFHDKSHLHSTHASASAGKAVRGAGLAL
jgi:hypothetical protein